MSWKEGVRGEVEVDAWGLFTTHHQMNLREGLLGELTLPALSNGGVFQYADGREIEMEKTSWWRGWHELRENGIVVGSARPLGFWGQRISIGYRGRMYELVAAGFWGDRWHLMDESGTVFVEIWRQGLFRQKVAMMAHLEVQSDLLVFAYYLTHARWQEQSAAAAAAAAGS
jgi:hypothetical protein